MHKIACAEEEELNFMHFIFIFYYLIISLSLLLCGQAVTKKRHPKFIIIEKQETENSFQVISSVPPLVG